MLAGLAVSGSDGQPEDAADIADDADAALAAVLGAAGVEPAADSTLTTGSSQLPQPQLLEVRAWRLAAAAMHAWACVFLHLLVSHGCCML